MKNELHNYPFPNSAVYFWFFSSPMILILIFVIVNRDVIYSQKPGDEIIIHLTCLSIISLIIMPTLAFIFANSIPALRLNPNGLEIQIYSPFRIKWIFLPWSDIDQILIYSDRAQRLLKQKKWIFIQSKRLPFFYLIVSIIYKRSLHRGFIITHRIQQYEGVLDFITGHKIG
jgi:hypothetical protein